MSLLITNLIQFPKKMSRYETLENALVSLFNVAGTTPEVFDIMPLPDNEMEYKPMQPRPQVYVYYEASEFTDPSETLSKIAQEERLNIGVEINSKTRRGEKGVMSIFEAINKRILGLKLLGYSRFTLVKFGALPGSGANHWVSFAQFTTVSHITDQQPDPDYTENILLDPEFVTEAIA